MIIFEFPHIANGQIIDEKQNISIYNHRAEISDDDPDGIYAALKNGGVATPLPPKIRNIGTDEAPIWTSRFDFPDLELGSYGSKILFSIDINTLANIINIHLINICCVFPGFLWLERNYNTFLLGCARWGNLGNIQLSKRNHKTLMLISGVPFPTAAEIATAKMWHFNQHFEYGKQRHRARIIHLLFDNLL